MRRFGRRASINWILFYGLPPFGAVNGRNGLNSSPSVQIGRHITPDHEDKLTEFEQGLFVQRSHGCTRSFRRVKGAAVALNTPAGRSAELDALFAYTGQTPGKRDKRTSMIYLPYQRSLCIAFYDGRNFQALPQLLGTSQFAKHLKAPSV